MRKKEYIFLLILIFIFSQCKDKTSLHSINAGSFNIQTPKSWKIVEEKSFDSFVAGIITNTNDTIIIEQGFYSPMLTEQEPTILPVNMKKELVLKGLDTSSLIFSDELDRDKFRKQNVNFIHIDNHEAKLVYPRRIGNGIVGVYFDSIGNNPNMGTVKLSIYGKNLDSTIQLDLINAIKSIKFGSGQNG
ncbi:MAG: hypothetical protein F9K23_08650 [Bacteroidetes bacterium]|nr:MAG: hypothetical protein F9K23_08650 [Bacteroidota bacterium]